MISAFWQNDMQYIQSKTWCFYISGNKKKDKLMNSYYRLSIIILANIFNSSIYLVIILLIGQQHHEILQLVEHNFMQVVKLLPASCGLEQAWFWQTYQHVKRAQDRPCSAPCVCSVPRNHQPQLWSGMSVHEWHVCTCMWGLHVIILK